MYLHVIDTRIYNCEMKWSLTFHNSSSLEHWCTVVLSVGYVVAHRHMFHSGINTNFACCITNSTLSCEDRPMFSILTSCATACVGPRDTTAVPDTLITCGSGFLVSLVMSNVMWHVASVWMYLTTVVPSWPLTCQKSKTIGCNENDRNNIIRNFIACLLLFHLWSLGWRAVRQAGESMSLQRFGYNRPDKFSLNVDASWKN